VTTLPFPAVDAVGQCALAGVTFTTDPGRYTPLQWPKDATVFLGLSTLTVQDFGIRPGEVALGSGETSPLDTATVLALHAVYRQVVDSTGVQFLDAMGNDFRVFVMDFQPVYREAGLWDYTLRLVILSITKLFGEDYVP
jgi:hypothetical protein